MNEVFKKKYLKYSPEITLEVFTLVWNRLIELGYKHYCNYSVDEAYNEFKGDYEYFTTTEDHPNEFNCYRNGIPFKETTVQEILGYDPFVKDDFVLPENWHVVVTEENQGVLSKWRNCTLDVGKITGIYGTSKTKEHNPSTSRNGFGNEITFEQFQKYVLKIETGNDKIAKTIIENSKNNDQKILELNSIQSVINDDESYLTIMENNLKVLKEALN